MAVMRALVLLLLLGCGACTPQWVHCERHLQPINGKEQPLGRGVRP